MIATLKEPSILLLSLILSVSIGCTEQTSKEIHPQDPYSNSPMNGSSSMTTGGSRSGGTSPNDPSEIRMTIDCNTFSFMPTEGIGVGLPPIPEEAGTQAGAQVALEGGVSVSAIGGAIGGGSFTPEGGSTAGAQGGSTAGAQGGSTAGVSSSGSMECLPSVGTFIESQGNIHISEGEILYEYTPPSSGSHRPMWAKWGEYEYLPPERWLHNLEHGGIAFLYHPCAPQEMIDQLRALARSIPDDDFGAFCWVMTPYDQLRTPIAVIAWEWSLEMSCVSEEELKTFISRTYRQAPEEIARDGSYELGWIGR